MIRNLLQGITKPLGGSQVDGSGRILSPEEVAERKKIAEALMTSATDTSPVGHWTAALNRGLQGIQGGMERRAAREAEGQGREGALERFNKRLSGNGAVDAVASALSMGEEVPVDTLSLLREFEGFRDTPYWDVNAHRTGYGSDTVTLADGSVVPVTPDMKITREDAERDLQRRVQTEFMPRAVSAVGEDVWGTLSEPQRAALTSIAYNYGRLPSSVARAVASGDVNAASQAIAALGSHNNGVNAKRRQREASIFAGAGAGTSQAPRAGNIAEIAALLADDWLPEDAKAVLRAEMGQQMQMQNAAYEMQLQQQDPLRQLQMQQAQLGNQRAALELEQLQNPAPKVRYEFAPNGELIAINETGGTVQSMGNFAQSPQAQSAIAKLSADRAAGLITDEEYQLGISKLGNQVNVNMGGGPELGKLSSDYGYVLDPNTGLPVIDPATGLPTAAPIPGSPAALALQKEQENEDKRETSSANTANIVLQDIDKAIEQTSGWTAGLGGRVLGNLPGTGATDLRATTDTIKANIGFDRLQQMREASPTGGALGGIAVQELNMLQAVLGSLDQAQSPEQLRANLARLKEIYEPIAKKAAAYPNAAQFGFDSSEKPAAEQEQPKQRRRYNPTTRSFE